MGNGRRGNWDSDTKLKAAPVGWTGNPVMSPISSVPPPRKVNCKGLHLLLPAIFFLILMLAGRELPAETTPASVRLPAFARALSWNPSSNTLSASMALNGIAFIRLDEKGNFLAQSVHTDWPALYALPLEEGRFLLAGRFGDLRLMEPGDAEGTTYKELASWKVEGVPIHLAREGETLYLASGAAGLLIYHWPDIYQEPLLRGRYAYVDYSKQIVVRNKIVYLADNFDTGFQIINAQDPIRPTRLFIQTGGFFDTVDEFHQIAAVGNRKTGTFLVDVSNPSAAKPVGFVKSHSPDYNRPPDVRRVAFAPDGRLLVVEAGVPARLYTLSRDQQGELVVATTTELAFPGTGVGEGIFLPDGRLVLSLDNGTIVIQTAP